MCPMVALVINLAKKQLHLIIVNYVFCLCLYPLFSFDLETAAPQNILHISDVAQNEVFHVGNSTDCYWLKW